MSSVAFGRHKDALANYIHSQSQYPWQKCAAGGEKRDRQWGKQVSKLEFYTQSTSVVISGQSGSQDKVRKLYFYAQP